MNAASLGDNALTVVQISEVKSAIHSYHSSTALLLEIDEKRPIRELAVHGSIGV
jgi:hypothetical protein